MSRAELVATMRSFGWTKTGELPGVCENWEPPTDVRDTWITVPLREDASDFEHYMRRAWNTLGRHEGPQLLAIVRTVEALHRPDEPWCPCLHIDAAECPRAVITCQTCGEGVPYPCSTAEALNLRENR